MRVWMLAGPFREGVGIELVDVLADLRLAKLLLLGVGRLADHFRDQEQRRWRFAAD